jgi:hypothetical protein
MILSANEANLEGVADTEADQNRIVEIPESTECQALAPGNRYFTRVMSTLAFAVWPSCTTVTSPLIWSPTNIASTL